MMNEFIKVTNQVIEEKLKDKIKLSKVEYSVMDQIYKLKVVCYTATYEKKVFKFLACGQDLDKDLLKRKFEFFITETLGIK